jgi:hypothetical protein
MVIRVNVEEGTMNDSRQFFSHSNSNTNNNSKSYVNLLAVKAGDIIQYQIDEKMWTGVIVETNIHNYLYMAEVQWFNDGNYGTVDVRDCKVIARA